MMRQLHAAIFDQEEAGFAVQFGSAERGAPQQRRPREKLRLMYFTLQNHNRNKSRRLILTAAPHVSPCSSSVI
jgi:hypothetical protein